VIRSTPNTPESPIFLDHFVVYRNSRIRDLVRFTKAAEKPIFLFDLGGISVMEYLVYSSMLVEEDILKPRLPFPPFTFLTRIVRLFLPEDRVFQVLAIAMVFGKHFHTQKSAVEIMQFHTH